jgi:hypothetical protein
MMSMTDHTVFHGRFRVVLVISLYDGRRKYFHGRFDPPVTNHFQCFGLIGAREHGCQFNTDRA